SEAIVRALPGAQHVIVRDAGHVIMLEHPDLLNQQLDALIERAGRRADEEQPAELGPRVRRVVTDVDKKRRIERGLERMDGQRRAAPGSRSTRERRREAS
ncbi:MAG TPA: alpha/beta hydrolase, partial [Lapillicoccus sp.]